MARSIYVLGTEPDCGKTVIALGLMEMLLSKSDNVGYFKPLANAEPGSKQLDSDVNLMLSHFNLGIPYEEMFGYIADVANTMSSLDKTEELVEGIMAKYNRLSDSCSMVLCEGIDYGLLSSISEFDLNVTLCKNLGCAVVAVIDAFEKSGDVLLGDVERITDTLVERNCDVIAIFINRVSKEQKDVIFSAVRLHERLDEQLFHFLPDNIALRRPTVAQIVGELGADVLSGKKHLDRHVHQIVVGASRVEHVINRIDHGFLIITPKDRTDILAALIESGQMISGIVLTDGAVSVETRHFINGISLIIPILSVQQDLIDIIQTLKGMRTMISADDERSIHSVMAMFDQHVESSRITRKVADSKIGMTPKMFEYQLVQNAKKQRCHIVLSEGEDERVLQAVDMLTRREVAHITILGNEQAIQGKLTTLGLRLPQVNILDPISSDRIESYAKTFYELRKHKSISFEQARNFVTDTTYFGTMMVALGDADGMVAGATHSTADTIRPSLQIIKTDSHCSVVSSVFFMGLQDKVLVYGDCAVNPDPSANQLAEIAISSAMTARDFGVEPVVAMLSYSSGCSGSGANVEKVREATAIAIDLAKQSYPGLLIDGPIQYDAAVEPTVASAKMPDSPLAGKANVLIFPDLNTGNNTYKAVQRSAGATAIGPVLQGLRRPVNDLSRGCSVRDIFTMVTITAIQAISAKHISSY